MLSVNKWTSDSPTAKQQHKYFLVNCRVFSDDNRDNMNNSANGRNGRMSRGDMQLGQQDYCCQLVSLFNYRFFQTTTETTGTTVPTGATAGCHEVTYNWDNKITVANSFSLSTVAFFQTTTETTGTTAGTEQRQDVTR